jgi:hypothetical protein
MPKLYGYFGLIVMFYANEHDPVHVHGKCLGREGRAGAHHEEAEMTAKPINILSADQVGDYSILLRFDDETEQTVNFEPFLSRSLHPDIHAFLDPVRFSTFLLEYGDLVWGDYDLCFPIIDLHDNRLEHTAVLKEAA